MTVDRRTFLQGLCTLLGYTAVSLPKAASVTQVDAAWELANHKLLTLWVREGGVLAADQYESPTIRAELYDVDVTDIGADFDCAEAARNCQPFDWFLRNRYEEYRDEQLSDGDDEAEEAHYAWAEQLEGADRKALLDAARDWFLSSPDWSEEEQYFVKPASDEDYVFEFLSRNQDTMGDLAIEFVEGDRPGSNVQYAQLTSSIADANRAAERQGIPLRFKHSC